MLDSIGVVDRNGDGWQDLHNSEPLVLQLTSAQASRTDIQINEMVAVDWENLAQGSTDPIDGSQFSVLDATATLTTTAETWRRSNHLVFPQWIVLIDVSRWAPLSGGWASVIGTDKSAGRQGTRDHSTVREQPEPGGPWALQSSMTWPVGP